MSLRVGVAVTALALVATYRFDALVFLWRIDPLVVLLPCCLLAATILAWLWPDRRPAVVVRVEVDHHHQHDVDHYWHPHLDVQPPRRPGPPALPPARGMVIEPGPRPIESGETHRW